MAMSHSGATADPAVPEVCQSVCAVGGAAPRMPHMPHGPRPTTGLALLTSGFGGGAAHPTCLSLARARSLWGAPCVRCCAYQCAKTPR